MNNRVTNTMVISTTDDMRAVALAQIADGERTKQ